MIDQDVLHQDRETLHPRIVEKLETLDRWQRNVIGLQPTAELCERAVIELDQLDSFTVFVIGDGIEVIATVKDLRTGVAPILRYFARQGYRQTGPMTDSYSGDSFKWHLGKILLVVGIEGSICRRVKVGEKEVPAYKQNIYEFRCGDSDKSVVDELASIDDDPAIEAAGGAA